MVNTLSRTRPGRLGRTAVLVRLYVVVALATVIVLAVLSAAGSDQATASAWVHAVIVAAFAVLLPLRLRSARRGSTRGLVAVGVIAAVLVVVNIVEAVLPGAFPVWMRIEMVGIAALMAAIVVAVARARR